MKLIKIEQEFCVCKLNDMPCLPCDGSLFFLAQSEEELSLVCDPAILLEEDIMEIDKGWKAFRVAGQLDFGMVGVLADISRVLAENEISLFAVSTFNTDYILVKEDKYNLAIDALQKNGYTI